MIFADFRGSKTSVFMFSANFDEEFRDRYKRRVRHADPTIDFAFPSRTDSTAAPEGPGELPAVRNAQKANA